MERCSSLISSRMLRVVSAVIAVLFAISFLSIGSVAAQNANPDWSNPNEVRLAAERITAAGDHDAQVHAFYELSPAGQQAILDFTRFDHFVSNKGAPNPIKPEQKSASSGSGIALHGRSASVPKGLLSVKTLLATIGGRTIVNDARYDSGCWSDSGSVTGQSAVGVDLWKFVLHLWWCGDGTWITDYDWWVSAETYSWAPLWEYDGLESSNVLYGYGYSGVQVWAQGEFAQCAAWCFQHAYPEVTDFGGGDGNFFVW